MLCITARESINILNDMSDQLDIFASMESVTESLRKFCRVQLCASLYIMKEAAIESDEGKARAVKSMHLFKGYFFSQFLRLGSWVDAQN